MSGGEKKFEKLSDRRKFLINMVQGVGFATFGGLVWSAYIDEAKASELLLRPPGALPEADFLKTCIKCGMCVEHCPYDTLTLAKPGDNKPVGTPYFTPRDIPCYMCTDIPCVPACPTGALERASVSNKANSDTLDINEARMGLAVIDEESCIAFWGIQCDACHRACPLIDVAITLDFDRNERTGKHAFLKPVVHSDACTGCGMCEHACVTKKPAIYVLPREVAMGEVDTNYVKGWDKQDEKRLEGVSTDVTTQTGINQESAIDSLNDMGDLFDE